MLPHIAALRRHFHHRDNTSHLTPPGAVHAVQDGTARSPVYSLDNGGSESLRVTPAIKKLTFMQLANAGAGSERLGSTINLHFEGNWMPVRVGGLAHRVFLVFLAVLAPPALAGLEGSCLPRDAG